ncbi:MULTISPECIES: flagellar biosynthetic protein FliO [unclassified Arthrobacter]|uniref:flagellar biosynthetic protein FliO n=1 Tax=unclassified Arthrobacter TaxID=235627 RepID=UPI001CFFE544|nr:MULTISPECIES: flagellar biosynthetic protein FliO [unclassified Arthrobacter]MCB5283788.1 hypothetical protein [Arthrobacter sp. ES1]WGZ79956.1 flagellar biosynthetic protein FliO [Arthrobacter sp. EM1]
MDSLILGLRVVVALGAVLGLMWLLQRRLGKGNGRRRADSALTVVSRQSLGQKASVVVVDAAGRRFMLGVTEHAVNVLHSGDIPAEAEEESVPAANAGFGEFARLLAAASPRAAVARKDDESAGDGLSAEGSGDGTPGAPMPRRSSIHRNSHSRGPAGQPPLHGSILAGSTWKQAAAALRGGRRR